MAERMTAHARLYETEDGRVVEEGDPAARALLYAEGDEIPAAEAKRLRLKTADGRVTQGKAPDPEPVYSTVKGAGPDDAPAKRAEAAPAAKPAAEPETRKAADVTVRDETQPPQERKAASVTVHPAKEDAKGK